MNIEDILRRLDAIEGGIKQNSQSLNQIVVHNKQQDSRITGLQDSLGVLQTHVGEEDNIFINRREQCEPSHPGGSHRVHIIRPVPHRNREQRKSMCG